MRLKNGWIGVVNRGQADIVSGASMQSARARELEFFRSKPCYASLKNVGTSFLSARLSEHLVGAIKRALPTISAGIGDGIAGLEKELEQLGGPAVEGRGGMVHLLLQLTRQFEEAFAQAVDGGKNGGEQILTVFEKRLGDNIGRLGFAKILEPANVRRVVEEADGSWSQSRYDEVVAGLTPFLKACGYNTKRDVVFLPMSGLHGHNIKDPPPAGVCPWYKGPTLFGVLDSVEMPARDPMAPFRLSIIDKYRDMGTIVMGKSEAG